MILIELHFFVILNDSEDREPAFERQNITYLTDKLIFQDGLNYSEIENFINFNLKD